MSQLKNNKINDFLNLRLLNNPLNQSKGLNFFKKLGYYLLMILLIFLILIFVAILVLLIRRKIQQKLNKMKRIQLQNEINKIMMLDIFETRSPSIDSNSTDFNSVSNDSTLSDISSQRNVLSEINVHNDKQNSEINIDN